MEEDSFPELLLRYDISKDFLIRAISRKNGVEPEKIKIDSVKVKSGSNFGEGFMCILLAIDVKATLEKEILDFNFMAKCLADIPYLLEFAKDVRTTTNLSKMIGNKL